MYRIPPLLTTLDSDGLNPIFHSSLHFKDSEGRWSISSAKLYTLPSYVATEQSDVNTRTLVVTAPLGSWPTEQKPRLKKTRNYSYLGTVTLEFVVGKKGCHFGHWGQTSHGFRHGHPFYRCDVTVLSLPVGAGVMSTIALLHGDGCLRSRLGSKALRRKVNLRLCPWNHSREDSPLLPLQKQPRSLRITLFF